MLLRTFTTSSSSETQNFAPQTRFIKSIFSCLFSRIRDENFFSSVASNHLPRVGEHGLFDFVVLIGSFVFIYWNRLGLNAAYHCSYWLLTSQLTELANSDHESASVICQTTDNTQCSPGRPQNGESISQESGECFDLCRRNGDYMICCRNLFLFVLGLADSNKCFSWTMPQMQDMLESGGCVFVLFHGAEQSMVEWPRSQRLGVKFWNKFGFDAWKWLELVRIGDEKNTVTRSTACLTIGYHDDEHKYQDVVM